MNRIRIKERSVIVSVLLLLALSGAYVIGAVYDVTDYGASGDGSTSDTAAINHTIDIAAANGGGTVYLPAGTFKSGSIIMKDNITLELSADATLLATDELEYSSVDYNIWGDLYGYQDWGHSHWKSSLIWGIGLNNVAITGTGLIDGRAMTAGAVGGGPIPDGTGDRAISFKDCTGILIENIRIFRAGHFGIITTGCSDVTINNVTIDTNRDGINIDCCNNVRITNCTVNSPGDDAICLKSSYALGYKRATEDVLIDGCTVMGYPVGHLLFPPGTDVKYLTGRIKFGTESNGGFKNITITNCHFEHCDGFMLATVDGGDIENINISDITMVDLRSPPIFLRLGDRGRGPGPPPPGSYRGLTMTNITAETAYGGLSCIASGIPGHMIEGLVFNNVTVRSSGGGTSAHAAIILGENEAGYPHPFMFGTVTPSYAFYLRHVDGVEFTDCDFDFVLDDRRPSFVFVDANDIKLDTTHAERSSLNDKFMVFDGVDNMHVNNSPDFPIVSISYSQLETSKAKVYVGEPFTIGITGAGVASDGIVCTDMSIHSHPFATEYTWANAGDAYVDIAFEDIQLYTPGEVLVEVAGLSLTQGVCLRSDFDMNYITDLEDIVVLAENWLNDASQIALGHDPAAWWSFYEGEGTLIHDVSGSGNNGTAYGNPSWVAGKYDNAIDFDGHNDYVHVPDSSSVRVGGGDYTISAWIYPRSVSGKHGIVTKVKDTMDKEYAFSIENGALTLEVERAANDGREATAAVVETHVWQHVMVVFDSTTTNAKFYIDGQLQPVISDSITALPRYYNDDLYIGKWGGNYNNSHFNGIIDDVRIYNYALQPKGASIADLDGDRKVTLADFALFSSQWLSDVLK